jgi:vancomycin resistance protein YoaR
MRRRLLSIAVVATMLATAVTALAAGHAATETRATALAADLVRPSLEAASAEGVVVPAPPIRTSRGSDRRSRIAVRPRQARLDSLEPDLVLVGTWTVRYTVGRENAFGANVELPLRALDGVVLRPGATFEFWAAIGEVSPRTGYRRGAVIAGDHVDPDGAFAGGICTASTAVFNAAARAGLEILERRPHGGYLAKYPLGLDAAVSKGDGSRQTVAFRNDTPQPILIRTVSDPGVARVDLYAATALGRTVELGQPVVSGRRAAHDRHVSTRSLPRGERRRLEPASDGMTVSVTRIVRDADGRVIHRDRWVSRYRPLTGVMLVGIG